MSSYKQQQEAKIRKLEIQALENAGLRKENIMLTESLKDAQEKIREMK